MTTRIDGLDTRLSGLVYKDTRLNGLVIDKSGTSQTICQINNKYQTLISPNHVYGLYGYIGYRGLLSKYRPTPGVSHTETLTVSHNGQGGIRRGYIEDTKPYLLVYTNHSIGHMRLYGLMV